MAEKLNCPRLYPILDLATAGGGDAWLERLEQLLSSVTPDPRVWLQLRLSGVEPAARPDWIRRANACVVANRPWRVVLNGTVDELAGTSFWGIHFSERNRPNTPVTVRSLAAVHDREGELEAARIGAGGITWSPVFEPSTKNMPGRGLEALSQFCTGSTLPVIALGGVSLDDVSACMNAGAAGVAFLGPISRPTTDPVATMHQWMRTLP